MIIKSAGSNHRTLKSLLSLYNNHHHHHRSMVSIAGSRLVSCQQRFIRQPTLLLRPMPLLQEQPQQRSLSCLLRSVISTRIGVDKNKNGIVSGGLLQRSFTTLPPHEIVGLPSLSPVRLVIVAFLTHIHSFSRKRHTYTNHIREN